MVLYDYEKGKQFRKGIRKGIPILVGFIPISTAFSVVALQSGLTAFEAIFMSIMVLAGASQLMAVNMLAMGTGNLEIIIATFIINIRHLIMSTCVMSRMKDVPVPVKVILAFGITDETFGIMSMENDESCNQFFFSGLTLMTYGSWVTGTIMGTVLCKIVPAEICMSISIALYAMFIAILMPNILKNLKVGLVVGISILLNSVFSIFLGIGWSVVFSTIIGGLTGSIILRKECEVDGYQNISNDSGNVNSNISPQSNTGSCS